MSITTLPEQLRRSLTWDQGAEMAQHARLRVDTGLPIYFCDPHSPWQQPSNMPAGGRESDRMPSTESPPRQARTQSQSMVADLLPPTTTLNRSDVLLLGLSIVAAADELLMTWIDGAEGLTRDRVVDVVTLLFDATAHHISSA